MSWSVIWEHLFIVFASGVLSIIIGLPLGIVAYIAPKARAVILRVVDLLQTVPTLALLGIIMVFVGAGKITVILGIMLYSLLPIVRNTCLGLQEVDPGVKEAARGMGMSNAYRVFAVELPLAFPVIITGIRIAIVNAIGTAVFATFVSGGGIGSVLYQGVRVSNMAMILAGTGVLMLIALVADLLMGFWEKSIEKSKKNRSRTMLIGLLIVLVLFVAVVPANLSAKTSDSELIVYDGNYSETQLLYRIVKLVVEDQTDLTVTIKDQMTAVNNFNELIGNNYSCDLMVSYDGTLLTTFLHLDVTDVPDDMTTYSYANQVAMEEYDIYLLDKLGFENTYAIAVPADLAEEYGLVCVSDLIPIASELVFGAEHEFFTQEGSMKYEPFVAYYGLDFKDHVSVDISLKYAAIQAGIFDVTEVYTTDGLNIQANLTVLEDDLNFFPEYNCALLVRGDTFERFAETAPGLEDALATLAGQISNDEMLEMTYRVDVLGEDVDDVALDFATSKGFLTTQDLG